MYLVYLNFFNFTFYIFILVLIIPEPEIERIAKIAMNVARKRNKKVKFEEKKNLKKSFLTI